MITLKYTEEDSDCSCDNKKFVLKEIYTYDESKNLDFSIEYASSSGNLIEKMITGKNIYKQFKDNVDEVRIVKQFDGMHITYINSMTAKIYYRSFVYHSWLLYFTIYQKFDKDLLEKSWLIEVGSLTT